MPVRTASISLLDLTDDLLNVIATHLPPSSRLSLGTTNKRLYAAVWGAHAERDIICNYPLERFLSIPLVVDLPGIKLRTVPSRSRQQHVALAAHPTGRYVAVLPYDNILRLLCPRAAQAVLQVHIHNFFANDTWDVAKGMRKPQQRQQQIVYADDSGLDVENGLDFSADGHTLVVTNRLCVRFYTLSEIEDSDIDTDTDTETETDSDGMVDRVNGRKQKKKNVAPHLSMSHVIHLADALHFIHNYTHNSATTRASAQPSPPPYAVHVPSLQHHFHQHAPSPPLVAASVASPSPPLTSFRRKSTGGAAQLSADGRTLAWVIFLGTPAVVHLTVWQRDEERTWTPTLCLEADRVWTRRWNALAWARPVFSPNGRFLLLVVNCAHKITRVINVAGQFHRKKLCRFAFIRVELATRDILRRTEWLDLAPDVYPKLLAEAIERSFAGCIVHDQGAAFASLPDGTDAELGVGGVGGGGGREVEEGDEIDGLEDVEVDEEDVENFMMPPALNNNNNNNNNGNGNNNVVNASVANGREDDATMSNVSKVMKTPGFALNSVHSCPAEATYKALSFGEAAHPWFVSKQPMFSFHFSPSGRRIVLAPSPHANTMRTMIVARDTAGDVALTDERTAAAAVATVTHSSSSSSCSSSSSSSATPARRRKVFRHLPWRESFATVTAFSASGQWLVGASLLPDDTCSVSIRNITKKEYFGDHV